MLDSNVDIYCLTNSSSMPIGHKSKSRSPITGPAEYLLYKSVSPIVQYRDCKALNRLH